MTNKMKQLFLLKCQNNMIEKILNKNILSKDNGNILYLLNIFIPVHYQVMSFSIQLIELV